ncbi:hypothetical protein ACGRPC_18940 [Vibrio diabolicus]|uniref:hypothetical protein n=1 Tax=Vibrio diabolicus TaxID=50719 RepID=UPI00211B3924|nr:hypothetical protein [Vibrio diabolicus]MCG6239022.1 hypothetical protein [Vibrio diabolicus]
MIDYLIPLFIFIVTIITIKIEYFSEREYEFIPNNSTLLKIIIVSSFIVFIGSVIKEYSDNQDKESRSAQIESLTVEVNDLKERLELKTEKLNNTLIKIDLNKRNREKNIRDANKLRIMKIFNSEMFMNMEILEIVKEDSDTTRLLGFLYKRKYLSISGIGELTSSDLNLSLDSYQSLLRLETILKDINTILEGASDDVMRAGTGGFNRMSIASQKAKYAISLYKTIIQEL